MSIEDGANAVGPLLDRFPDTDCIFCVSDRPAFGALSAMKEQGKHVPNDIGIVGFGNFELSRFATPAITTVTVDPYAIGQATGRLIEELLSADDKTRPRANNIDVSVELSFRGSTKN